jgi:hypothetical protein
MKLPDQEYIVIEQTRGTSHVTKTKDEPMTTIKFKGVQDKKIYPTYIVDSFKNRRQWECILSKPYEKLTVRFDPGYLSNGNTIDADSKPYVITKTIVKSFDAATVFADAEQTSIDEQIKLIGNFVKTIEAYCNNPEVLDQARSRLAELESEQE